MKYFYRVWTRDGEWEEEFSSLNKADKAFRNYIRLGKKVVLDRWVDAGYGNEGQFDGDYESTIKEGAR